MTAQTTLRQKLTQDAKITLLTIDATGIGGSTYRFCNGVRDPATAVEFDSVTYLPRKFEIDGLAAQAGGSQPRPKLKIDNVDRYWYSLVRSFDYLVNSDVTVLQVYRQHLDDGSDPDTSQILSQQEFVIRQMSQIMPTQIEFALRTPLDLEQLMVGRQMLRHTCPRPYRVPDADNSGQFFESTASHKCPYTGSNYFKADGTSTATWTEDDCGQKRSDCVLRFGATADLPYMGFPTIGSPRT